MSDWAVEDAAVIERRIGAVRSVRRVVHTIWALARAQLPQVEEAAQEASVYLDWVDGTIARLAGAPRVAAAATFTVVFGPERGYCGALPRRMLAAVPASGGVGLVGHRLVELARHEPTIAPRVRFSLAGAVTADDLDAVAHEVAEAVLAAERRDRSDAVAIRHPARNGLAEVLIVGGAREPLFQRPETFSPVRSVLDVAVREAVTGRLAVAVAETLLAEVRARLGAADRARRSCDDRLESLAASWRAARQDQITAELLEIVAGRLATG